MKRILLIPQVYNLEDEILFSTDLKRMKEFLDSKSDGDFKRDLLKCSDSQIIKKLKDKTFKIERFWSRTANNKYGKYQNQSKMIKVL